MKPKNQGPVLGPRFDPEKVGVNKKTVDKKLCSYKRKEKNSQRALNQK
jgi:hypothetical protein